MTDNSVKEATAALKGMLGIGSSSASASASAGGGSGSGNTKTSQTPSPTKNQTNTNGKPSTTKGGGSNKKSKQQKSNSKSPMRQKNNSNNSNNSSASAAAPAPPTSNQKPPRERPVPTSNQKPERNASNANNVNVNSNELNKKKKNKKKKNNKNPVTATAASPVDGAERRDDNNSNSNNNNNNESSNNDNRRRTFSESSSLSTNTIDCDVVPRGTIYLLGSTVEANEFLTRPEEDLYVLSIINHETAAHCHLATRTVDDRDQWILHIRRICQDLEERSSHHSQRQSIPPRAFNGAIRPYRSICSTETTPRTPMRGNISQRMTTPTDSAARNEVGVENICSSNLQHSSSSQECDSYQNSITRMDLQKNGSIQTASLKRMKKYSYQVVPSFEKEILILFGPLILYKLLLIISCRLGALCFVATSVISSRWVVLKNLTSIMRILPDGNQLNDCTKLIGHGSTCCRFTVDLTAALLFLANKKVVSVEGDNSTGNEILMSHILIKSLATVMSHHTRLISRKYPLLPRLYSVDVAFIDLKSADTVVWVNKADEISIEEIANSFKSEKDISSPTFWQEAIGPTCRIITTPDFEHTNIELDLNLKDCPIVIFISGTTQSGKGQNQLNVSINLQSTDVSACQKFAEHVQKCIQFLDKLE
mmetsp:Transcript_17687/g.20252  ORF Transcript_17687/g.20252 Transcript_17687/m.20252 type:complete len:650 (-) Transcript_17687:34-1983(-)